MTEDNVQALLAKPPNEVDFAELSAAVEALETKVENGETELQDRRTALDKLKDDRDALRGYRNFVAHFSGAGIPRTNHHSPKRGSKSEAILRVLSDGKPRSTAEIRKALIAEGAMDESESQAHTLQVTLSRLFRKRELKRVRLGVYKRASASADEDTTQVEEAVR